MLKIKWNIEEEFFDVDQQIVKNRHISVYNSWRFAHPVNLMFFLIKIKIQTESVKTKLWQILFFDVYEPFVILLKIQTPFR